MIQDAGLTVMVCLALIMGIFPSTALAHRVIVFAWVEDGRVQVEGGFGKKTPAVNCDINAFDKNKKLIFKGKTDDQGRCTFVPPADHSGAMTVELSAGPGHKGMWTIEAQEFEQTGSASQPVDSSEHQALQTGADPMKIFVGIGLIFGLALAAAMVKKRKKGDSGD